MAREEKIFKELRKLINKLSPKLAYLKTFKKMRDNNNNTC